MSNNTKRILFFTLTILFSAIIPMLVVALKYKLFEAYLEASTAVQVSIIGCVLIIFILLFNIKKVMQFLNDMPFSVFKCIINGVTKLLPLICIMTILVNINTIINDLTYVTSWLIGCNAISLFVFEPLWRHYTSETRLDIEYNKWHARELKDK